MSKQASLGHLDRTAAEPRDERIHYVILSRIEQVNPTIRLFRLTPVEHRPENMIKFSPGQWLDVYCPGIPKPGGFTITSSPSLLSSPNPYLELAIQESPLNPPAAYLWRPEKEILGKELEIRVGGSFTWPSKWETGEIEKVVFVAGGVGVNPIVSMVCYLAEVRRKSPDGKLGFEVCLLYSVKEGRKLEEILFLKRLIEVFNDLREEGSCELFLTGEAKGGSCGSANSVLLEFGRRMRIHRERIQMQGLLKHLGSTEERAKTVCYVCGPRDMTDMFTEELVKVPGMKPENVLYEKWW